MILFLIFIFGLAVGSLLNVCIHRMPKGESIIAPRSHCPRCGKIIAAWDNIPIISYLLLQGRCRSCQQLISVFYPLVEILAGSLLLVTYQQFCFTLEFAKFSIFGMLLLILIFTDLQNRIIPHAITIFGLLVGIISSWFVPVDWVVIVWELDWLVGFLNIRRGESFLAAVSGMVLGGGSFYLIGKAFYLLNGKRKEYLGFGDVMLMAMIGSFLGVQLTLLTIFLGSLLGTLIGIPLEYSTQRFQRHRWPFGAFLGLAALFSSLEGGTAIEWYIKVSGLR